MATTIALDRGDYAAQAIGTTRAMKLVSADEYLNYELFQDVVRTTLWGQHRETIFVPLLLRILIREHSSFMAAFHPHRTWRSGEYTRIRL